MCTELSSKSLRTVYSKLDLAWLFISIIYNSLFVLGMHQYVLSNTPESMMNMSVHTNIIFIIFYDMFQIRCKPLCMHFLFKEKPFSM